MTHAANNIATITQHMDHEIPMGMGYSDLEVFQNAINTTCQNIILFRTAFSAEQRIEHLAVYLCYKYY